MRLQLAPDFCLRENKDLPPKDYYDTFIKAGEVKLISSELSKKVAPWAGLRNRIVHEYAEIKDRLVFEKVEPTIENFGEYVRQIEKFIESKADAFVNFFPRCA